MPVNHGRKTRRVSVTASARRLVHRRALSARAARQLRQPLQPRGFQGARDRVRFPAMAPARYERRIMRVARPCQPALAPRRRSAVIAWSLVAAGVAVWATALGSADALFLSSAPVAAAVAAPVVPALPEHAAPAQANEEYLAAVGMRENVWRAIAHATEVVGVDAAYMTAVAARESGFDPAVHAEGTSAAGLYQFTQDTWLRAVKIFGVRHGLTELAQLITIDEDGDVSVRPGSRAKLLALRNDPKLSALMAAELARDNKARLERLLGRGVSPAETYLAHFLGVGQAARIIAAAHSRPQQPGRVRPGWPCRLGRRHRRQDRGLFQPRSVALGADLNPGRWGAAATFATLAVSESSESAPELSNQNRACSCRSEWWRSSRGWIARSG
jgi:hypothetical protein